MFDLTKEISLDKKNNILYRRLQIAVYLLAIAAALYLTYLIIFPTQYFSFSFLNPNSTQNTIINPRDKDGNFADRGRISGDTGMIFDAASPGNFSQVKISFTLDKKSELPNETSLSARKSYQAFFYPDGGTLDSQNPDVNPELPDGSLVSYGKSVYIISGNSFYPIDSVETFNAAGFNWNDVIPVSSDMIANYEKAKLFTLFSPHPDGTIMSDENNNLFLIKDGKKLSISQDSAAKIKRAPIKVTSSSLDTVEKCQLTKNILSLRTYSCTMPLEKFKNLIGKDYEFRFSSDNDIKLETIEADFETSATLENIRLAIADILTKVKRNYYGEPTQ